MAEHMSGDPNADDRFVRPDDGDMHVVEDGKPGAPALLLLGNAAAPTAIWDPVVPLLAGAFRVIRVDLLGHGRSASPAGGYDISTQARRVAAALDSLGVSRVTVIGHSSGCTVATALAEQRPDAVVALVLIDMGPSLDAKIPERLLFRLLLAPLTGRLLWRLRTEAAIRRAARIGFTRPVDIPDAFVEHMLGMTHRAFVEAMRAPLDYLGQRSLPDRLAALGVPVLVIFGTDDRRWRSSSAADVELLVRVEVRLEIPRAGVRRQLGGQGLEPRDVLVAMGLRDQPHAVDFEQQPEVHDVVEVLPAQGDDPVTAVAYRNHEPFAGEIEHGLAHRSC